MVFVLNVGLALACTAALGADLRCLVTRPGGLQQGVTVRAWPAGCITRPGKSKSVLRSGKKPLQLTAVTGSDGMAIFRGLGAGDCRVAAEKAAGGSTCASR